MKKQVVVVSCDLCGNPVTETHVRSDPEFSFRGVSYQLDLCPQHAEEFAAAIAPFVAAGRRVGRPRRPVPARKVTSSSDLKAVREWAQEHGYPVSTRGRVPAEILAAFESVGGEPGEESSAQVREAPARAPRRAGRRSSSGGGAAGETKAIREWAKANGRQVGDRGRIPAEVIAEYRSAISAESPAAATEEVEETPVSEDNVIALAESATTNRKPRRARGRKVAAALS